MKQNAYIKYLIILLFLFSFSWILFSAYKVVNSHAPDFYVLWESSKDVFTGNNPYINPNINNAIGYPPNTLLFYTPLTIFSYTTSITIFTILSILSLFVSVGLIIKIVFGKFNLLLFIIFSSLSLLSFPFKFTLGMGQNNTIALFMLALAYYLFKKNSKALSGVMFGLTYSFKTILGFSVLFLLIGKKWKILLYTVLTMLVLGIITSLVSSNSIDLYKFYLFDVIPPLFKYEGSEIYYHQGFLGFISRTTQDVAIRKYLYAFFGFGLVGFSTVLIKYSKNDELKISLLLIVLLLIDKLSWQHHFIWLMLPFIVLTKLVYDQKNTWHIALLAFSYILVSWNFKNPEIFSAFPKSLILSNNFYGAIILMVLNMKYLLKEVNIKDLNLRGYFA